MDWKIRAIVRNSEKKNEPPSEEEIMGGWNILIKKIRLQRNLISNLSADIELTPNGDAKKNRSVSIKVFHN